MQSTTVVLLNTWPQPSTAPEAIVFAYWSPQVRVFTSQEEAKIVWHGLIIKA